MDFMEEEHLLEEGPRPRALACLAALRAVLRPRKTPFGLRLE